jgi:hypothetical protein
MGIVQSLFPIAGLLGSLVHPHLFAEFTRADKHYHWMVVGVPYYVGGSVVLVGAALLAFKLRTLVAEFHQQAQLQGGQAPESETLLAHP